MASRDSGKWGWGSFLQAVADWRDAVHGHGEYEETDGGAGSASARADSGADERRLKRRKRTSPPRSRSVSPVRRRVLHKTAAGSASTAGPPARTDSGGEGGESRRLNKHRKPTSPPRTLKPETNRSPTRRQKRQRRSDDDGGGGAGRKWTTIGQIGMPGKEGISYLVEGTLPDGRHVQAVKKEFKPTKALSTLEKEVIFQMRAAKWGLAPEVYDWGHNGKKGGNFILMERMYDSLPDVFVKQGGKLTEKQQMDLIRLAQELTKIGIYHNDGNPLNVMQDADGKWRYIDFGMAVDLQPKHSLTANFDAMERFFTSARFSLLHNVPNSKIPETLFREIKRRRAASPA